MGEIIDHRDDDSLSIAATISLLLSNFGLQDVLTPQYDVQTYQIRYRTQNRGQEIETTGLVSLPVNIDMTTKVPMLLWTHPTTGFSDSCAPSGQGLEGAAFPMLFASTGMIVMLRLLRYEWLGSTFGHDTSVWSCRTYGHCFVGCPSCSSELV